MDKTFLDTYSEFLSFIDDGHYMSFKNVLRQSNHSLLSSGSCNCYVGVSKSRCIFGVLVPIVACSRAATVCHRLAVVRAISASIRTVAYLECWCVYRCTHYVPQES